MFTSLARPQWDESIKGAVDRAHNPAFRFFTEVLPRLLPPERRYIASFILPEAPLEAIITPCDPSFANQQVDFYCPRAKLVIEIDGAQHREPDQQRLDQRRDAYLRQQGIETVRIPTPEVDCPADIIVSAIAQLADRLEDDVLTYDWEKIGHEIEWQRAASYELLLRTQMALLQLMRTGVLDLRDPEWRIAASSDALSDTMPSITAAAFEDICDMVDNLCLLLNRDFQRPLLTITRERPAVELDIGILGCWSEAECAPNVVYARSDYFENRNYFTVACAPALAYDTLGESRREPVSRALRFFLKRLFGFDSFRSGQEGIIRKALARNPTLGILPTGSGKSICYQMACLLQPCISLVVCPIVSLIQDQERNLANFGITRATRIDGQMNSDDKHAVTHGFGSGRHQIIWVSPERFQIAEFRNQLSSIASAMNYGYAVIDEVHCLSEWGHDFRVSYLKLPETIKKFCPHALLLGLTATASFNVLADLKAELGVRNSDIQTAETLDRSELTYHIKRVEGGNRLGAIDSVLDELNEHHRQASGLDSIFEPNGDDSVCGIIFANTKKNARFPGTGCKEILEHLIANNISADAYHADRGDERGGIQRDYLDNKFTVMVATKAFGMGVDKPNVRYTIHSGLPWSIEAFYQEAGRAGRSNDPSRNQSDCYILYVPDPDAKRTERLFAANTTVEEIKAMQNTLRGDLSTLFHLWSLNHDGIEEEKGHVFSIYKALVHGEDTSGIAPIDFNSLGPHSRGKVERALYRLAIMDIVEDWTVEHRHRVFNVRMNHWEGDLETRAKKAVEDYIGRHSSAPVSFDDPHPSFAPYAADYQRALPGKRFFGLIDALLKWTNDHIVFNRRRAIGNMLALCESNRSEEEMRNYINRYFKLNTDIGNQLDLIVGSQRSFQPWVDIFYTLQPTDDPTERVAVLKTHDQIADLVPLCDRYRESNHGDIGLEWTAMMSHLLSGECTAWEIRDQLSFVFEKLSDYPHLDTGNLLACTLELAARAPERSRDVLGEAITAIMPQQAHRAYQLLGDSATLAYLLEESLDRLERTWGRSHHDR
ncbi:RecQ family ATP-dependent DNA helicase [Adlercreutzia sp. R21]|uniref:RecQ family ATP-dependent DNA helicase n=1 Tax=Adlercreutzia wanghongyangiae TaxID=3111451 RepID=UPI002DC041F8|nr:RecQ family ATP-dependent DNA helicase [Adlercreutzia sp. R21]MEC4183666.1 RecQ family ATP-dependent DNA helicase [Adlercreutzia sp. R21]